MLAGFRDASELQQALGCNDAFPQHWLAWPKFRKEGGFHKGLLCKALWRVTAWDAVFGIRGAFSE